MEYFITGHACVSETAIMWFHSCAEMWLSVTCREFIDDACRQSYGLGFVHIHTSTWLGLVSLVYS